MRGVRSLPPQTKNPTYGPGWIAIYPLNNVIHFLNNRALYLASRFSYNTVVSCRLGRRSFALRELAQEVARPFAFEDLVPSGTKKRSAKIFGKEIRPKVFGKWTKMPSVLISRRLKFP